MIPYYQGPILQIGHFYSPSGLSQIFTMPSSEPAVRATEVSEDSLFFASGSDDGMVKIWDCQRLEKNVTNRARLTHACGGRVTDLAVCKSTHLVAAATANGTVQVRPAGFSATVRDSSLSLCVRFMCTGRFPVFTVVDVY